LNDPRTSKAVAIALSGSGGSGVITAGTMLLQMAARAGLYGMLTRTVGPQIRGGEAASLLRVSSEHIHAGAETYDAVLAIDWHNFDRLAAEIPLRKDSLVVVDPDSGDVPQILTNSEARIVELPMQQMAKDISGGRVNMVALGALSSLIGLPEDALVGVIEDVLSRKGKDAAQSSIAAARAGIAAAASLGEVPKVDPAPDKAAGRWIISGNQAAGLGAIRGGIRFVAAYPITPATEVLEWMAPALTKVGGRLVQAEDELASINMVIGASYGGIPSLTATSGPGIALMAEAIGLAVASEVPAVIVDVMRCGPSTGIATKSEQGDLNIAVYGLHGDAPHVVVAPLSVEDCLATTQWAVHIAESLQTPALVLSDQLIGQAQAVIDPPADLAFLTTRDVAGAEAEGYRRYAVTASGVSPMAIPGTPGTQYTADGLTHNERGAPSTTSEDHLAQLEKRQAKFDRFDFGSRWADVEGDGSLAVVTWGSTAGAVREALTGLEDVRMIALRLILPVQPERLKHALDGVERVLVVEQSHSGQFHHYLRAHYDLPGEVRVLHRPGPQPLGPSEILDAIRKWN
jgi:2-oxoglutarate ferredoxin oxidoreductase subunit alpha